MRHASRQESSGAGRGSKSGSPGVQLPQIASGPLYDRSKATRKHELERLAYPEINVSGIAHVDPEVAFFIQVSALLRPDSVVLDFGAGRGEFMEVDPSAFRRDIQNLRGRCAKVHGCDPDPSVLQNETLDSAEVVEIGKRLPYPDDYFDLIVSRYVFEHVDDPEWAAGELLRVLKPGGWICAMTPNKWGYVALAARLVPNRLHARTLARVQPGRLSQDVFPTVYKLNRPSAVRRYFGHAADVFHYSTSPIPAYHFGSMAMFRALQLLHRLTPPPFDVGLRFFIRKRP